LLPARVFLPTFSHYELVADLGGVAQVAEDEAADGVEVLAFELGAQALFTSVKGTWPSTE
jgi:hypothetical protein